MRFFCPCDCQRVARDLANATAPLDRPPRQDQGFAGLYCPLQGGLPGAIAGAATGAVSGTAANIRKTTLEAGGSASAMTPALRAAHAAALARSNATAPIGSSLMGTPHGSVHRALVAGRVSGGGG